LIGIVFLLKENHIFNFKIYLFPIILMIIGANFLFNPRGGRRRHRKFMENKGNDDVTGFARDESYTASTKDTPRSNFILMDEGTTTPPEENLEVNAILGGIKKNILSKNFIGGTVTCFMGGAELNLLHADIRKPVIIECNNIFGGTKILVPSNWDIKNDITAIFGGVDDKRKFINVEVNHNKTIYLKGTCLFGGIEITNY
jgi:predicted membrane protein